MKEEFNKPERGGKPGVYQIENAEGEKVNLIADNHPMADAYIRMEATYVMTLEEWYEQELSKKAERVKAKASSDKKGK